MANYGIACSGYISVALFYFSLCVKLDIIVKCARKTNVRKALGNMYI